MICIRHDKEFNPFLYKCSECTKERMLKQKDNLLKAANENEAKKD